MMTFNSKLANLINKDFPEIIEKQKFDFALQPYLKGVEQVNKKTYTDFHLPQPYCLDIVHEYKDRIVCTGPFHYETAWTVGFICQLEDENFFHGLFMAKTPKDNPDILVSARLYSHDLGFVFHFLDANKDFVVNLEESAERVGFANIMK